MNTIPNNHRAYLLAVPQYRPDGTISGPKLTPIIGWVGDDPDIGYIPVTFTPMTPGDNWAIFHRGTGHWWSVFKDARGTTEISLRDWWASTEEYPDAR